MCFARLSQRQLGEDQVPAVAAAVAVALDGRLVAVDNETERDDMLTFILWLILLIVAWPLALLALILYPFVWVIGLPLRLVGISVKAVLELVGAIVRLPARVLRGPRGVRG